MNHLPTDKETFLLAAEDYWRKRMERDELIGEVIDFLLVVSILGIFVAAVWCLPS